MIVISDTGPLHYLYMIGQLDILQKLYGRVVVPRSIVDQELQDRATPESLRGFFASPPPWLILHDGPAGMDPSLLALGLGEREAISLALELHGDLLLCDDGSARKRAAALGIAVMGTLGLLNEAACRGLLDFDAALEQLTKKTNFYHTQALISQVRQQHQARANKEGRGP